MRCHRLRGGGRQHSQRDFRCTARFAAGADICCGSCRAPQFKLTTPEVTINLPLQHYEDRAPSLRLHAVAGPMRMARTRMAAWLAGINALLLDNVDLDALKIIDYDGLHPLERHAAPHSRHHHLVLRTADVEAWVRRFYVDVLGCSVEREQPPFGLTQLRAMD
ncbi:hypothetical protein ACTMU2_35265 [Cupriavidus basilensis]